MANDKILHQLSPNKRVKIKVNKRLYLSEDGFYWIAEPQVKETDEGEWFTYNHHLFAGWVPVEEPEFVSTEDESTLNALTGHVMLFMSRIIPEFVYASYQDMVIILRKLQNANKTTEVDKRDTDNKN